MTERARVLWILVLTVFLAGCPVTDPDTGRDADEPETVTGTIDEGGGTIEMSDGTTLSFEGNPDGGSAQVTISEVAPGDPAVAGLIASRPYEIRFEDVTGPLPPTYSFTATAPPVLPGGKAIVELLNRAGGTVLAIEDGGASVSVEVPTPTSLTTSGSLARQATESQTIDVGEVYPTLLQFRGSPDQDLVQLRRVAECGVDGVAHDVCFVAEDRDGALFSAPEGGIEAAVLVEIDDDTGASEFGRITADIFVAGTSHAIGTGGVALAAGSLAAVASSMSAFASVVNIALNAPPIVWGSANCGNLTGGCYEINAERTTFHDGDWSLDLETAFVGPSTCATPDNCSDLRFDFRDATSSVAHSHVYAWVRATNSQQITEERTFFVKWNRSLDDLVGTEQWVDVRFCGTSRNACAATKIDVLALALVQDANWLPFLVDPVIVAMRANEELLDLAEIPADDTTPSPFRIVGATPREPAGMTIELGEDLYIDVEADAEVEAYLGAFAQLTGMAPFYGPESIEAPGGSATVRYGVFAADATGTFDLASVDIWAYNTRLDVPRSPAFSVPVDYTLIVSETDLWAGVWDGEASWSGGSTVADLELRIRTSPDDGWSATLQIGLTDDGVVTTSHLQSTGPWFLSEDLVEFAFVCEPPVEWRDNDCAEVFGSEEYGFVAVRDRFAAVAELTVPSLPEGALETVSLDRRTFRD